MKKIAPLLYCFVAVIMFMSCKKDNYPGGVPYNYIGMLDLRGIYDGTDKVLTKEILFGGEKIAGVVISDHRGGNSPANLLILQDARRLNLIRGIAIDLGANAADYVPGDSLEVDVVGATLTKVAGILQLKGVEPADVKLVSSGNAISVPIVKSNAIIAYPDQYESTLLTVAKGIFDNSYPSGTRYVGNKILKDGFGSLLLHTEPTAAYANDSLPFLSNFTGILLNYNTDTVPQLWPRSAADINILALVPPKLAALIITGYLADVQGTSVGDSSYEYVQLMATRDIDFTVNNFSMVTTNNAGAATPTGFPANGWATGGLRTYKININSGTISKGQYLYVGSNKNIWGPGSTDISSAKWFTKAYASTPGDGFGNAATNLLANSGNAAGIAIFDQTNVTADSIPVDVIFYGGNGSVYSPGPPARGYRITNTDYYDTRNPANQALQPYFNMGSNTGKLGFAGANFSKLGGTYSILTGRWSTARTLTQVPLTLSSPLSVLEGATTIEE
ncbi:MAG: hypothetical protein EOO06_12080 [Chitinophagaceae bacterium]|nr:MAG: hypothetical protein EOO06_12080 [Chitinophagaceae bacterium]